MCTGMVQPGSSKCGFAGIAIKVVISYIDIKCLNLNVTVQIEIDTYITYEGWNFNSGNYLFTTDTK